jgi:hypothetical protein
MQFLLSLSLISTNEMDNGDTGCGPIEKASSFIVVLDASREWIGGSLMQ